MKCNSCGKEIPIVENMIHCPFCGMKIENEVASDSKKSIFRKELNVSYWFRALIVWWLIVGILTVLNFTLIAPQMEKFWVFLFGPDSVESLNWLSIVGIIGIGIYFTLAYVVYSHAKEHNRRAVAWATAFIIFTPVLGGLFYLLSWPKE